MQQQGLPGMTIALGKNGTMLYVKAYGVSNVAAHLTTQTNTIFEIGSITKQFTAALIMKLQEQGKLQVDDPLDAYLPAYNFPSAITLRMLLTHTSGLADYTTFSAYPGWATNGVSEATLLTAVSQVPLLFQPGTQWSYSNSNYFALGAVIEKITGQSYEANLDQYIIQPLGLTSTYYSLPPSSQSAIGYTMSATGLVPALIVDRSAPFAAGALSSDVNDLAAWDSALISGKVVSPASFKEMTTPIPLTIGDGSGSYGFGLELGAFNGRPTIWHDGAINGFNADTEMFLDSGFAVEVLVNRDGANPVSIVTQIITTVCNSPTLSSNC
jgi:CubicO group peptidase (beta-lactamase class C family)